MISDDFVVIVPRDGSLFLAEPGADLSELIDTRFFRESKAVALKDGRSISGAIFRARETDAADEIRIHELLNARFVD